MKTESLVIFSDTIKKQEKKSEAAVVFKRENEPQADTACVRESSKWK